MEVCCERRSAFFHDPSATFNLSPWNILQTHMLIQLIISGFFSVRVCLCHRSRSISGASSGLSTSPLSSPRVSQSCKMFSCSATVTITVQSITDILLPFTDTLAWENCNVVHHQYFTTTSDMHLATDTDIDTVFLNPIKYVTKTGHLTILICFYIILGITNDITLFLLNVT